MGSEGLCDVRNISETETVNPGAGKSFLECAWGGRMLARDQGELRRSNSQAFDFPKVIALVRRDLKRAARTERAMN